MRTIETLFLRAKHWQMFLVLFVVPTIAEFASIGSMKLPIRSLNDLNAGTVLSVGAILLYVLCMLAWLWSMGSFFTSIVDSELRLNPAFFRFAILYSLVYFPLFFWFVLTPGLGSVAIVIPHLFCMFCMFYSLNFVSKGLVTAETGKPAPFYSYAGPFFLIWFYPIGVWFIQPKVNQLFRDRRSPSTPV